MRSFFHLLVASTLVASLLACKKQDDTPPAPAPPLTFTVTTLAGATKSGYADGTGTAALFNNTNDLAVDQQGNLYVSDAGNNRIRKVTPAGVVSTLAGSGITGRFDGAGNTAQFDGPAGMAVDAQGLVYVADSNNDLIRVITPAGAPPPGSLVPSRAGLAKDCKMAPWPAPNFRILITWLSTSRATSTCQNPATTAFARLRPRG